MKKRIKVKNIIIIFIIPLLFTIFSETYAKYISSASVSDKVTVANWSFKLNGEEIAVSGEQKTIQFNLFNTIKDSDGTSDETNVATGLIAPGTSGQFEFLLENTSDVDVRYSIIYDVTNNYDIPINYSSDGGLTWSSDLLNVIASSDTVIEKGASAKSVTIDWKWPFDADNNVDVSLGKISQTEDVKIIVKATFKVVQLTSDADSELLRISILGDSISTLKGYIPETNRARYVQTEEEAVGGLLYMPYASTWWGGLINDLGGTLGINESWAGSTVSNSSSTNSGDVGPDRAMASMTRISALDDNGSPDIILFYGGTNDAGKGITVGTFDNTIELNTSQTIFDNFADSYAMAILRMKYLYPGAEIISLMPTYTTSYYTTAELESYNAVIKEICDYYGIKSIDLRKSGITTNDLSDGIHPNAYGMKLIKEYVKQNIIGKTENINLYDSSFVENKYYDSSGNYVQYNDVVSMKVSVNPKDRLYANSFQASGTNGGTQNGIRITFFRNDAIVSSLSPTEVYQEYKNNGYVTVPLGVDEVSVAWWNDSEENYLYVEPSEENLYDSSKVSNMYYDSNGNYVTTPGSAVAMIVDVEPGNHIVANSFQASGTNGGSNNGIRITYLNESGIVSTLSPTEVYEEYSTNGYLTVPDGVTQVCISWWSDVSSNYLYIE